MRCTETAPSKDTEHSRVESFRLAGFVSVFSLLLSLKQFFSYFCNSVYSPSLLLFTFIFEYNDVFYFPWLAPDAVAKSTIFVCFLAVLRVLNLGVAVK